MVRKCANCGKEYKKSGRGKLCPECAEESRKRICTNCGKEFKIARGGHDRLMCYQCSPSAPKNSTLNYIEHTAKPNGIDEDNKKAREMGMTYGQYQLYKWKEAQRIEMMANRLNRKIKEEG